MNKQNGKCLTHCKDYPNCKPCPQIEADEYLNSKNLFDSTDGKDVITTNYTGLKAMLIDFLQRQGHKTVSLEELFLKHQEFSIKTFISSTPMSSLEGLKIEADEAIDELGGIDRDYDGEALPLEYVDCLMYLMDSIARAGIPLERIKEMFVKKLAINAGRKWKINKNGSYSHI